MSNTQIKNQRAVLRAFEENNLTEFHQLLDFYTIDVNRAFYSDSSILERVLETPNSSPYIDACCSYGANIFKRNERGLYPLHYAIKSCCAGNLQTFMTHFAHTEKNRLHHYAIVNVPDGEGNNFLHVLVRGLTGENYRESSHMIDILLSNSCNPNHHNNYSVTPFEMLLLREEKDDTSKAELLNLFLEKSKFVIELHPHENLMACATAMDIRDKVLIRNNSVVDLKYLADKIYEGNGIEFASALCKVQGSNVDYSLLLTEAIKSNSAKCVDELLKNGLKSTFLNDRSSQPPLFLALSYARHEIVKILLKYENVNFEYENKTRNVLHELCSTSDYVNVSDVQQCFELIIRDKRCTSEVINTRDSKNRSPLMYACDNEYDEIAKELLKRGAYIDEGVISPSIKENVLSECLDDCMTHSGDLNSRDLAVQFNYRFLIPPRDKKSSIRETKALKIIAKSPQLNKLVTHPLIKSYIDLKWRRVNYLIYFGLFAYFLFLLYLSSFILKFFNDEIYRENNVDVSMSDGPHVTDLDGVTMPNDVPFFASYDPNDYQPITSTTLNWRTEVRSGFDAPMVKFAGAPPPPPLPANFFPAPARTQGPFQTTTMTPVQQKNANARSKVNVLGVLFGKRRRRRDVMETKSNNERAESYIASNRVEYLTCLTGILLITIHEILELVMTGRRYFIKLSNWLDCTLLYLSYTVFINSFDFEEDTFQKMRAVLFLVIALQGFLLAAKVTSLSFQLEIFKKVGKTFIKFILLYSIIIFAFAMSFYTIYENTAQNVESEDKKAFANIFISSITIIRMMLSDFENIKLNPDDQFHAVLFLIFMLLITGILFNLMNALAINDTQELMKYAEIVETTKRIKIINRCEKTLQVFNANCFNVFSSLIPTGSVIIKPNYSNEVLMKTYTLAKGKLSARYLPVLTRSLTSFPSKFSTLHLSDETIQKVKEHIRRKQLEESESKIYCV